MGRQEREEMEEGERERTQPQLLVEQLVACLQRRQRQQGEEERTEDERERKARQRWQASVEEEERRTWGSPAWLQ
jgi:hypothetical protein